MVRAMAGREYWCWCVACRIGTGDVVVRGEQLLLRYTDAWGTNVIVLRKVRAGEYVGRYLNTACPAMTAPFAARIVSPERIDGAWISDDGWISRWDFRRQLKVTDNDTGVSLQTNLESNR